MISSVIHKGKQAKIRNGSQMFDSAKSLPQRKR